MIRAIPLCALQIMKNWIGNLSNSDGSGEAAALKSRETVWAIAVSIFCLGGMIGGSLVGWSAERLGRKGALLFNNVFVVLTVIFQSSSKYADSYLMFILGRLFIGVNSGLNAGLVPMYLSEVSPMNLRGAVGSAYQLIITMSILFANVMGMDSLLGTTTQWPWLFAITLVPAIFQLLTLPFCPETPKYLMLNKGQDMESKKGSFWLGWVGLGCCLLYTYSHASCIIDMVGSRYIYHLCWIDFSIFFHFNNVIVISTICVRCKNINLSFFIFHFSLIKHTKSFVSFNNYHYRAALTWLRSTMDVQDEMEEIRAECESAKLMPQVTMRELVFNPTLRMPLIVALMIMLAQQLSGINAVMFFSTTIFKSAGLDTAQAQKATLVVGVVNVLMTFVSLVLVEKSGRKTLLVFGFVGITITTTLLALSLPHAVSVGPSIAYSFLIFSLLKFSLKFNLYQS